MKRLISGALLFVSLFLIISSLAAQETNQSLADIARKERERKKDQTKPPKVFTNEDVPAKGTGQESSPTSTPRAKSTAEAKSSSAESDAAKVIPTDSATTPPPPANKVDVGSGQPPRLELSPAALRAFRTLVILADAEEQCFASMQAYAPIDHMRNGCRDFRYTPRKEFDPQYDDDYQYSLDMGVNGYHIRVDPRRNGQPGFYYDGDELYYNPTGPASATDQTLRVGQIVDLARQGWASR